MNQLLIRKLAVAFVVAFAGTLLTTLVGISEQASYSFGKSIVVSAIVGAVGAGARAVLALGPFNLVPSDAEHSIVKP